MDAIPALAPQTACAKVTLHDRYYLLADPAKACPYPQSCHTSKAMAGQAYVHAQKDLLPCAQAARKLSLHVGIRRSIPEVDQIVRIVDQVI
jgi:hypothetical protein